MPSVSTAPTRRVSPSPFTIGPAFRWAVILGGGLLLVLVALALGRAALGLAPSERMFTPMVALHLASVVPAIPLGMVVLLSRKGDARHRLRGGVWMALMLVAAASSFGIRHNNEGALSWIHIFSFYVLTAIPLAIWSARTRRVALHARLLKGMFLGALIIAGLATFVPGRIMFRWAFA